jgi:hypothetical protein
MQNKNLYILLILLLISGISAEGQKLVNSPYSRFNLGSLEQNGSFRSSGMGGIGIALRDNNSIQFYNPASYSSFDTLSFIFDLGIDYSKNILSDGVISYTSDDMNFHHFIIGFPISKGLGISAGIIPYSNGYYNLSEQVTVDDPGYDPLIGEIYGAHRGTGGYNKVFIGSGLNISKNFSAGINLTVLFGQIGRINQVSNVSDFYTFDTRSVETLSLNGINYDFGLQYFGKLKNNLFINAGLSFTPGKNYKSDYETLNERYSSYVLAPYSPDTLEFVSLRDSKAFLPKTIRLGVAFGKKDIFVAGIDYLYSNWSSATLPGTSGYLADSQTLRFGIEYTPEKFANTGYLKAIDYRLGGHFSDNYLILNGTQLSESGITIGFGLPMLGSVSKVNLFFDYTKRQGTTISGLPYENIYSVGLSINMYDYWFLKRKYN